MNSLKTEFDRANYINEIESARWIAEQAVLKLSELTPQSQTQCASMIANELSAIKEHKSNTIDSTLDHDELSDIANYFKNIN